MPSTPPTCSGTSGASEIQERLVKELAERLRIEEDQIDVNAPLTRYGIDSAEAASLAYELEIWLGRIIHPGMLYDAQSIADLAQLLAAPPEDPAGG